MWSDGDSHDIQILHIHHQLFSTLQNGPFVKAKETSTGNHFIQHKIYIKYQNVHTFKFKLEKAELNLLVREAYIMLLNLNI